MKSKILWNYTSGIFLVLNVGTGQREVDSITHLDCYFPSGTVEGQASHMEPGLCALAVIWEYLF